jgi:inositol phosphorylceramide mannosyltransferase catalytic subunit
MSIPKNIYQTHKSINYINTKPKLVKGMRSWVKHSNKLNYFFYNNKMCDDFIKNNFDEKTYKAYSMLPIAVMKADLWRYCIIYHYGGIYADTDTVCKINPYIFINDSLLTIVPENETHLCQWVFSAPKNSPILKSIIDLSVERILNTPIKGEHIIHYLTGPALFTDGIEKYLIENNYPIFENKKNYHNYPNPILLVFNYDNFHKNIVQHLFAGQDQDGWCKERYNKLM